MIPPEEDIGKITCWDYLSFVEKELREGGRSV